MIENTKKVPDPCRITAEAPPCVMLQPPSLKFPIPLTSAGVEAIRNVVRPNYERGWAIRGLAWYARVDAQRLRGESESLRAHARRVCMRVYR